MDSAHLRRKDTTKGPPLRVLSLDGGGVRGYSMLVILQELMYRCFTETEGRPPKREEIPKPCDYFDLIAGTGTGGLIAIMLGRLRLDLEMSMDVYVRMTKKVFETDKTIAGIPYKHTLFKASKLEEAIKACVREHTIFEDEGNDGTASGGRPFQSMSPVVGPRRSVSVRSSATSEMGVSSPTSVRNSVVSPSMALSWGNPEASLYDGRENRTKTAVTAVYKGTKKGDSSSSVFLRSYDSRKEPPPDFNCSIWQAGRATSAIGLAFKPIKIGQNIFIDEGAGKYNPSPQVLEEAVVNEWPGREMGIFVSIGTGKRPGGTSNTQSEWWEGFVGGSVGAFAEARRRLIGKIEGCEDTHVQMRNIELPRKGIPLENYCRLNVEVGVGEFGMNEWDRVSDMNTSTRKYLGKEATQEIVYNAAVKMAKIELMKRRFDRVGHGSRDSYSPGQEQISMVPEVPPPHDYAVEMPANEQPTGQGRDEFRYSQPAMPYGYKSDEVDKFMAIPSESTTQRPVSFELADRTVVDKLGYSEIPQRANTEKLAYNDNSPRTNLEQRGYSEGSNRTTSPPRGDWNGSNVSNAPPRPPKTPINDIPSRPAPMSRPNGNPRLPYPDNDGPPPVVNKSRKPEFIR